MSRPSPAWTCAVALLSSTLLIPGSALAGRSKVDEWNARLQRVIGQVKQGDYSEARKESQQLLGDMMDRLDPDSKNASHAFGLVLLGRSLAEAGLGNEREAAWDFQAAQQIDPQLETWDLSEFGPPATVLARHRLGIDPQPALLTLEELERVGATAPQRVEDRRQPRVPGSIAFPPERDYSTAISVALDSAGVATHPRIVINDPHPGVALGVLDYLRDTRFQPARRDGTPLPALYVFRFHFKAEVQLEKRLRPRNRNNG